MRGGLAHVNVLTSMFFGGMIGSSTADLAGTGSIVIPAMKENGYPAPFSAALTASSAGIGPMIPPSSPMILYSAVTGTSLGALFLAGVIPGILLGLSQAAIVAWLARRRGWKPYSSFAVREIVRTGRRAVLSFGLPVIIVGGLVIGVFTPTEAGAFAVVYALVLATIVYRVLTLKALLLLAIIAGMILDPLIPVLLPIILPTLLAFNVDLLHFGVLMVIAVVIGQVTPPLAIALIIAGRIANVDQMVVLRANMPFLFALIAFMFLAIAIPEIATWLPGLMRD